MGWFLLAPLPRQGYDPALLPLTVAGIPSIHICLDFIPELLAQPQLEKQVKPSSSFDFHLFLSSLESSSGHIVAPERFSQLFFFNLCDGFSSPVSHRFLQSSCCRTCVLSMLCPSPSVWPDWLSVSWGPSSQVRFLLYCMFEIFNCLSLLVKLVVGSQDSHFHHTR